MYQSNRSLNIPPGHLTSFPPREGGILMNLHTQLPEHDRSYCKVSRGGGIWSPGMDLRWGIWTAFRPREWGIWTKFSKNSNARGVARGGMFKLRFDWYIRLQMRCLENVYVLKVFNFSDNTFIIAALILGSTEFCNYLILVSIRISFVDQTTVGLLLSIQLTLNFRFSASAAGVLGNISALAFVL